MYNDQLLLRGSGAIVNCSLSIVNWWILPRSAPPVRIADRWGKIVGLFTPYLLPQFKVCPTHNLRTMIACLSLCCDEWVTLFVPLAKNLGKTTQRLVENFGETRKQTKVGTMLVVPD